MVKQQFGSFYGYFVRWANTVTVSCPRNYFPKLTIFAHLVCRCQVMSHSSRNETQVMPTSPALRKYCAVHGLWSVTFSNDRLEASHTNAATGMFGQAFSLRCVKYRWPCHAEVPSKQTPTPRHFTTLVGQSWRTGLLEMYCAIIQGESSSLCWLTKGKQLCWGIPSWTQLYCQIYKNISTTCFGPYGHLQVGHEIRWKNYI